MARVVAVRSLGSPQRLPLAALLHYVLAYLRHGSGARDGAQRSPRTRAVAVADLVSTDVSDTGRAATQVAMIAAPEVAGYERIARLPAYGRCATARPETPTVSTVAAGSECITLASLLDTTLTTLNDWRAARGVPPVITPPFITAARWHRFFLPLAERHLTPIQLHAVRLLGMFESYTSMAKQFEPTHQVTNPGRDPRPLHPGVAETKPRLAMRNPQPWARL